MLNEHHSSGEQPLEVSASRDIMAISPNRLPRPSPGAGGAAGCGRGGVVCVC